MLWCSIDFLLAGFIDDLYVENAKDFLLCEIPADWIWKRDASSISSLSFSTNLRPSILRESTLLTFTPGAPSFSSWLLRSLLILSIYWEYSSILLSCYKILITWNSAFLSLKILNIFFSSASYRAFYRSIWEIFLFKFLISLRRFKSWNKMF
jgi:hypothetical protein